jgi:hypothetical protein
LLELSWEIEMRPLYIRLFVVGSLIWMTASVIDIVRQAPSRNVLIEYLGLMALGFVAIFLVVFCTQWLIECIDTLRYGTRDAKTSRGPAPTQPSSAQALSELPSAQSR